MRAYILIAIILAAFASGGATAWRVQGWRHDAAEKQRIEQEAKEQGIRAQRIDVASVGHEADKEKLRTEFLTITQTVEKIVREPFYVQGEQCLDDDGLNALRSALGAQDATGLTKSEQSQKASQPANPSSGALPK